MLGGLCLSANWAVQFKTSPLVQKLEKEMQKELVRLSRNKWSVSLCMSTKS